jgi:hypothetical protein
MIRAAEVDRERAAAAHEGVVAPSGAFCKSLGDGHRDALRDACRRRLVGTVAA